MEDIFSTKQRIKLLKAIILKTDNISVNNIASQQKLSKGLVSKYFDILLRKNILKKINGKFIIVESPLVKAIKICLTINSINTKLFNKYPFVKGVGLYGSGAKGENTAESDVDLWIRIENTGESQLAHLTSELNKRISDVKILFLTEKKIKKLKEDDALFYNALVFGSIVLLGDRDGIQI